MIRPNTLPVITVMADAHTLRNMPKMHLPRNCMSSSMLFIYINTSVAISHPNMARPFPTIFSLFYLLPKSFFKRDMKGNSNSSFLMLPF